MHCTFANIIEIICRNVKGNNITLANFNDLFNLIVYVKWQMIQTNDHKKNKYTDMVAMEMKCVELNTGEKMPLIAFGTHQLSVDEIQEPLEAAIAAGYRHIDTASINDNEMEIGATLRRLRNMQRITRRELFITAKLWNTFHRADLVRPAFMQSLKYLQLDYIDLYLIHTPCAFANDATGNSRSNSMCGDTVPYPRYRDKTIRFDHTADYVDTWLEIKKLYDDGLARNVGVANFNIEQLQRIITMTGFVPAVLQIECNPFCVQTDLSRFCASHGIHVMAHSPMGTPSRLVAFDGIPLLLDHEMVHSVAAKYGKTVAQILIRYQLEMGHSVVVKSQQEDHIRSNIDVFDFQLDADDMRSLNNIDINVRCNPFLELVYSYIPSNACLCDLYI